MSQFKPSEYQQNILNFIENKSGNLLVDAKAGSGKTSTLCLIADKIIKQNKKCLFLAFNKSIVDELNTRIISDNCMIKTLHSLGLSFIRSYLYKKHKENYILEIDQHDDFIKEQVDLLFNEHCMETFKLVNAELSLEDLKDLHYNITREIAQMVNYCRLYNINYHTHREIYDLAHKLTWHLPNCDDYGVIKYPIIIETIIDKIKDRFQNPELNDKNIPVYYVGYTDMIYFPCLYKMYAPFSIKSYLDYILLDEVQDLSVLQQLFVKLVIQNNTRLIAVGDEKQSIYAFAGADTKSIRNLKTNFLLSELPLNICYRCPENVIKLAQDIVPEIDWNHTRDDKGEVVFVDEIDLKDKIKAGDVIVARRNNDLVRLYKKLVLDDKISVKFKNLEMVNSVVTEINRVIKDYIKRYNTYTNIEKELYEICDANNINWKKDDKDLTKHELDFMKRKGNELVKQRKKKGKSVSKSNYNVNYLETCMLEYKEQGEYNFTIDGESSNINKEYFDVINTLLEQYKETNSGILVKDFLVYVENFLKGNLDRNVPTLSSIHMMKGGEADNVYIIDYPRFPYIYSNQTEDAKQQERNLQYVALTRPKKNLYLCKVSRCRNRETEDDLARLNTESECKVKMLLSRK